MGVIYIRSMGDTRKEQNNGGIPQRLLHELNEHAVGGFILFYYNSESGSPEHIMSFDTPAHCLGLQKYMADWGEALHNINVDEAENSIRRMGAEMNNDELEDDEEDDDHSQTV